MPTPDITLFHAPMSRSLRPRWVLEEMGIPYKLERPSFDRGDVGGAAYKAINPLQKIPALQDGDTVILESLAQSQYLAERYGPSPLIVKSDEADYPRYLEWLFFGEATMCTAVNLTLAHAALLPEAQRNPALARWGKAEFLKHCQLLAERGLADDREWLAGGRFTLADVSVVYMLFLMKIVKQFDGVPETVNAYFKRATALDSWKRASAD
jgi:glutathione S-transferase